VQGKGIVLGTDVGGDPECKNENEGNGNGIERKKEMSRKAEKEGRKEKKKRAHPIFKFRSVNCRVKRVLLCRRQLFYF
jgi:hypothetical protein